MCIAVFRAFSLLTRRVFLGVRDCADVGGVVVAVAEGVAETEGEGEEGAISLET